MPGNPAGTKVRLTQESIKRLRPRSAAYIAWDAEQAGYGVKVHPSGVKSHVVDYRANGGGRNAPHRRTVIARAGAMPPREARRMAKAIIGEAAAGADPRGERARARAVTVGDAFDGFMASNPRRAAATDEAYRSLFRRCLAGMARRPLADVSRTDVEALFNSATARFGPSTGNKLAALLGAMCRRACAGNPAIGDPAAAWRLGGGRRNPIRRRKAPAPAEALPAWRKGVLACAVNPTHLALLAFLLRTGARRGEASRLTWADVDRQAGTLTLGSTKSGVPLILPITAGVGLALDQQSGGRRAPPKSHCVFPSPRDPRRPVGGLQALHRPIAEAGGAPFWSHALRNCFITVAMRDLGLPSALVKRLVNHAPPRDVTEGYASDWTLAQVRDAMERVGERIDELMGGGAGALGWDAPDELPC